MKVFCLKNKLLNPRSSRLEFKKSHYLDVPITKYVTCTKLHNFMEKMNDLIWIDQNDDEWKNQTTNHFVSVSAVDAGIPGVNLINTQSLHEQIPKVQKRTVKSSFILRFWELPA